MLRATHRPLVERFNIFDVLLSAPEGSGVTRLTGVWSAASSVRERSPDVAVVMAPSFESALTTWMAGVPTRVGHDTDGRRVLLTSAVPLRADTHRTEVFRDLARALGATGEVMVPPLCLTEEDRDYAARLFKSMSWNESTQPLFLNPASAKTPRAWSSDRYRTLAERLTSGKRAFRVVVHARDPFSAPQDWAASRGIALVDNASLSELAAVLERCALYVGNDSGPCHLAAAVGIRTVTIFGPSIPQRTGPRSFFRLHSEDTVTERNIAVSASFACAPCRERFFDECPSPPSDDGRPPCLDAITVETLVSQIEQVFKPN